MNKNNNLDQDTDDNEHKLSIISMAIGGLFLGLFVLCVPAGIKLFLQQEFMEEFLVSLGIALIMASTISLVFQQVFQNYSKQNQKRIIHAAVDQVKDQIKDVSEQLDKLSDLNDVLRGAHISKIESIYTTRKEALDSIRREISGCKNFQAIGISLRDFLIGKGSYHAEFLNLLKESSTRDDRNVQMLILNPLSDQAVFRAERESTCTFSDKNPYEKSDLYSEVNQAINFWNNCEYTNNENIKAKVYNSAPSCFLLITDNSVYIEQYHYAKPKEGVAGGHYPVYKFDIKSNVADILKQHFDYIWQASGTKEVKEHNNECCSGISKNAWESHILNLFINRRQASDRINYILKTTKGNIDIVGISLREFLHPNENVESNYYSQIEEILYRNKINAEQNDVQRSQLQNIRVLLLDPDREQGIIRSKREDPGSKPGNLKMQVDTSINRIEGLKNISNTIEGRLYHGSPVAFILMTDESLFLEQYHYGSEGAIIAGGKINLIEYSNVSNTYKEFKGHINFIWNELSRPAKLDKIDDNKLPALPMEE